jgi:hypothetical protein
MTDDGGSAGSAGSSKGGSGAKAGSGSTSDGGTKGAEGGTSSMGEAGAGEDPLGEGGGGSDPNPPTGLTGDGITGTFDGMVHAHTFNPTHVPQQTETQVIMATSMMYPLYDAWTIRFYPKLGEQACTGDVDSGDTFITFGSQTNYALGGTTAGQGGACKLNITSIAPSYTGTFTASLVMESGVVAVTDGAFSVPN